MGSWAESGFKFSCWRCVFVCVICVYEYVGFSITLRYCNAHYIAARLQSVPWVKFTGLAITGVNNPALSVALLPV